MTFGDTSSSKSIGGLDWESGELALAWRQMDAIHASVFSAATERMLDLAQVRSGMHVLDVAAGAGGQTLPAARRVGERGQVVAVDLSANMLEVARASLREHGVTNVQTRVMDAQRLELEPDTFDAGISRFGIMLMAEPVKALAEIRRVLKPRSRLAFMVWSTPENNPFMSMPFEVLRQFGLMPLAPGLTGPYALVALACSRQLAIERASSMWLSRPWRSVGSLILWRRLSAITN